MKKSKYQEAIFSRFKESEDNLIIEAVAGSGKTTTIVELLKEASSEATSIFIAFNKHIATELSTRVPLGTECKTLHSLGFSLLRDKKLDAYKTVNLIQKNYKKIKEPNAYNYARVISLLKANGYFEWEDSVVENILAEFDIDDFDISHGEAVWNDMLTDHKTIDFDEMIWLPVFTDSIKNSLHYDTIFIDEAQDLSPIQIMFLKMIKAKRIIAVGDTHQAIYAFRGADKNSMSNIKEAFNMVEMPLSISYRCKEAIVKEAQKIVPHIEYHRAGGTVESRKVLSINEPGSMILCRVNAPLVKECLNLIKQGKPAIVRGKDIADGLIKIIKNNDSIDAWYSKAMNQKGISEGKKVLIEDKYDTLKYLWKGSKEKTISSIKDIFSDTTNSSNIILSTIHKAKGLEAENVSIIRTDLLPHPRSNNLTQEMNLKYVAVTRAKESLCFIQ